MSATLSISAVLFDLDDTLNDRPLCWSAFIPIFQKQYEGRLGPCTTAQIAQLISTADDRGYRVKESFFQELSQTLPWIDRPSAAELETFWRGCFADCMVERAGAKILLSDLRSRGFRIGIVSNGRTDMQTAKIARLGFHTLTDVVLISESVGIKKPDAKIFRLAIEALGCDPGSTLFVGDHPILDIAGAKAAGMQTAWLCLDRDWPVEAARPKYIISTLDDLRPILGLEREKGN